MSWIHSLSQLTRGHLAEISVSITAMVLVVLTPFLNKGMKAMARPLHWIMRYALFVLMATAGGGLLTHFGVRSIHSLLRALPDVQLLAAVTGVHLLIAWLLKRENQI
jgi:hypothetical protein